MSWRNEKGFTLIEIAIVLVVVTLLLGGVFVGGHAVLENARTASLLGQIKDLAVASRDFKSRYGYFPGDLPNAAVLITTEGGISSGCSYPVSASVGNGIVDTTIERVCALEHLVKAQMLSKIELNVSGGNYVINHPFGGGIVSLSVIPTTNENAVSVSNLPCKFALRIDDKLDNASTTPLASGSVIGVDPMNLVISGCVSGGGSDPVGLILVRY